MNLKIKKATESEKEILWNLLQFALYDGSIYTNRQIDNNAKFEYTWFENYFLDNDRSAYFIMHGKEIIGFAMVNCYLKVCHDSKAQTIAEFLILPTHRRKHLGKEAAYKVFDLFSGEWEVQPMENNPIAYKFWQNIIAEYSEGDYKKYEFQDMEDVFVFRSNNINNSDI